MTSFLFPLVAVASGVLAFVVVRLRLGVWRAESFEGVSPVTLTPLSVLAGFLVGFLALHVWGEWDKAKSYVGEEATALREAVVLARVIDPALGQAMKADVRAHVARMPDEWRDMAEHRLTLGAPPPELTRAIGRLTAQPVAGPAQQIAVERCLDAIDRALEARRYRILLSEHGGVGAANWAALLVLTACLQLSIAGVHTANRGAQVVALSIFTVAVATCFAVLAAYDHPYRDWPTGVGYGPIAEAAARL